MTRLTIAASLSFLIAACGDSSALPPSGPGPLTPVESVPQSDTIQSPGLTAPVDVVRDEWGIPHIYGASFADVAFAQGYTMAQDRLIAMDLGRRLAEGTVAELVGDQQESVVDQDIGMRLHHMRKTAETIWAELSASTDDKDKRLSAVMTQYVAGINAYIADLQAGKYTLPTALLFIYSPAAATQWDEADVMALGLLQAFYLTFDADSEIRRSQIDVAGSMLFDNGATADLKARAHFGDDLQILEPVDDTFTLRGWPGLGGAPLTADAKSASGGAELWALLDAARRTVTDMGNDRALHESRGSNNWVLAPGLTKSGHVLVANDTHLTLSNPATFYMNHLKVHSDSEPADVMGVQFPGAPGVILGMNPRIAWGATVNYIDVTDVYKEAVVACDGSTDPCVMFQGKKVPLMSRVETFKVGSFGKISKSYQVTLYDVPHHGPILPRITATHDVEALGSSELSVRYTGYEPAQIFRAVYALDTANNVNEAVAALERDFKYGGENWVIGDADGHIGWTQTVRVPRRQPGFAPWKVLPGDGSAEWGPDMDSKFIPQAYDPAQGYIVTANNDPIGVTEDNDPFFNEPVQPMGAGSGPLYLGADYDAGTRIGRITKRIQSGTAAGGKLDLDDMQAIQSDAVTEWGPLFMPALTPALQAIAEEVKTPGSHPEISAMVAAADPADVANLPLAQAALLGWSFDTPSAVVDGSLMPTAKEMRDSLATLLFSAWLSRFARFTIGDELSVLNLGIGSTQQRKLLSRMVNQPEKLSTGISPMTHDPILFDDLGTPGVIESRLQIAARAFLDTLPYLRGRLGADLTQWRWGQVHTLTLEFPAGIAALNVPAPDDASWPNGYPRHGDDGTVDVGGHGLSQTSFTYDEGPAIRFVCELSPDGPKARNVLPGGQVFDPGSPHYADQMQKWRYNQSFDLAYTDADVLASALKEYATNQIGRVRFTPPGK